MSHQVIDQDAIVACADLGHRSGATSFEIGYLHDDVPIDKAGWYATVIFQGAKLIAADAKGPTEAADALARRLLADATCTHCKMPIVLGDYARGCRWRRMGDRWKRGCEK